MRLVTCLAVLALGVAATPSAAVPGDELTLTLDCDTSSMEQSYVEHGCWAHLGIHQYFPGVTAAYELLGGSGSVFSVEQQLSPPVEPAAPDPGRPGDSSIPIEVSMDSRTWTKAGEARYRLLGPTRQGITFSLGPLPGVAFRFVRVRQPLSAAQGLSGYLDHSLVTLQVREVAAIPPPALVPADGRGFACLDAIMEDAWSAHPCTYGGIDRWDAPSFFHTYFLDDARLDRVAGTAVLAYFRPEDPGTCCGQTLTGVLTGSLLVQSSADGVAWDTLVTVPVTHGAPVAFDADGLGGRTARFVRLVGAKHPGYWNHPALKHPEGYLVASELRLWGLAPA